MKKIDAIITPFKLDAVNKALCCLGIQGMTVTEVKVAGEEGTHNRSFKRADHPLELIPKLKVEIIVSDSAAEKTVETIYRSINTYSSEKDAILVTNIDDAVRIRTFQKGEDAIT